MEFEGDSVRKRWKWAPGLNGGEREDHRAIDGQLADEEGMFTFPDGIQTPGPGRSGYPEHDCNCCCRVEIVNVDKDGNVLEEDKRETVNEKDAREAAATEAREKASGKTRRLGDEDTGMADKPNGGGSISHISEAPINGGLFPDKLANAVRSNPMTQEDAGNKKPNPNYGAGKGYKENCSACVVAYEARLRGYDVQAKPYTENPKFEKLSKQGNTAWVDPKTGKHPDYISNDGITSAKEFAKFLKQTIEPKARYTLDFEWDGRRKKSGHIISVDRDENNALRFYDPQSGKTYQGEFIDLYLNRIKYKVPPTILRIDDKCFNLDIVNHVLERVSK